MWIWLPLTEKYVCMWDAAKIGWTHWIVIEYMQGKYKFVSSEMWAVGANISG